MKTFINYLLVCVIIGMTQACSQKTFEEEFVDENPIAKTGIVKFKYQGYIYTSKYERNGDVFSWLITRICSCVIWTATTSSILT